MILVMVAHMRLFKALQGACRGRAVMQIVMRAVISYVAKKHASTEGHGNLLHEHITPMSVPV